MQMNVRAFTSCLVLLLFIGFCSNQLILALSAGAGLLPSVQPPRACHFHAAGTRARVRCLVSKHRLDLIQTKRVSWRLDFLLPFSPHFIALTVLWLQDWGGHFVTTTVLLSIKSSSHFRFASLVWGVDVQARPRPVGPCTPLRLSTRSPSPNSRSLLVVSDSVVARGSSYATHPCAEGERTSQRHGFPLHGYKYYYYDTVLCRQRRKQAPCAQRLTHMSAVVARIPCLSCGCPCDPPHNDSDACSIVVPCSRPFAKDHKNLSPPHRNHGFGLDTDAKASLSVPCHFFFLI